MQYKSIFDNNNVINANGKLVIFINKLSQFLSKILTKELLNPYIFGGPTQTAPNADSINKINNVVNNMFNGKEKWSDIVDFTQIINKLNSDKSISEEVTVEILKKSELIFNILILSFSYPFLKKIVNLQTITFSNVYDKNLETCLYLITIIIDVFKFEFIKLEEEEQKQYLINNSLIEMLYSTKSLYKLTSSKK